jgi:hypothetical protein
MALIDVLRGTALLALHPKRFAAERSATGRRFFGGLLRALHFPAYRRRRRLRDEIPESGAPFAIPEGDGFLLWSPAAFPPLERAVAEARALFDAADLEGLTRAMPEGDPYVCVPHEPAPGSEIAALATHEGLIRPLSEYMGVLPILHTVQLMYSPNRRLVRGTSQNFHLDGQDLRSAQVFVYLDDVSEENGPVTLLKAGTSERVVRATRYRKAGSYRRIDDEVVARHVDVAREARVMTGSAGSVLIFDGDRCLHYGSRPASRPRRILQYSYLSPFAFTTPPRWWERFRRLVPDDAPAWRRGVVERV